MHSKKQKSPNYWTDTEFHNSIPEAGFLRSRANKQCVSGIVLLLLLNVLRNFTFGFPIFVLLVAAGYIVSIVLCVKALIYAFRLKKLYQKYKE